MTKAYERVRAANVDINEKPHGWIQWKGTDVCMDVRCSCGYTGHVDSEFAYRVECGGCGKIWHVSPWVRLVEQLPSEESDAACDPISTDKDLRRRR
jgi:hypothetical protein